MALLNKRKAKYYRLIWLKYDLPAGISVFLIALPLCLGIALASGAPLYSGILAGIIGGLIVSLISGSQLAVSGPAAGLTTVVSAAIISFGDYKIFMLSVIAAGIFQLTLGLLKLGVIANYFPSAVIKGMLAAIGIILMSKQIPIALGYDQPDFWTSGLWTMFTNRRIAGNIRNFNLHISRGAILIAVVSLVVMILMQRRFAKRIKLIPAPLMAVIAGIIVNLIFSKVASAYSLKQTQLVNIPMNLFKDLSIAPVLKLFSNLSIWKTGIVIGLLASLETLLCIEAIDKLDK